MFQKIRILGEGEFVSQADATHEQQFGKLVATLSAHSAAAVCFERDFCAVVYPLRGEWAAIVKPSLVPDVNAELYMLVLSPLSTLIQAELQKMPDANKVGNADSRRSAAALQDRRYSQFPTKSLFAAYGTTKQAGKVAFVVFHSGFQANINALTKRLTSAGIGVYHSTVPGSWNYFLREHCTASGGVVLLHNSFPVSRCWLLPRLESLLSHGRFRFYRFFDATDADHHDLPTSDSPSDQAVHKEGPSVPVPLFPSGQAVYLMDDIIEEQHHDALPVLRLLSVRAKSAKTSTFVLGRPGLIDWAGELVCDPAMNVGGDLDVKVRQEIFELLHDLRDSDNLCEVISLDLEEVPDYDERWQSQQAKTANEGVKWYASWGLEHAQHCRRFFLLSMMGSSRRAGWKQKYAHLSVRTPSEWCDEERRKEDKKQNAELAELRRSASGISTETESR